ncbi:toxin-antitoxin system YwqK family antitoxin [uncultured Helicobacter sp.]|uniref:toxin-antitoxin system YwqK family antitoxin n=1 Tax=uncultured Helicobacter sp. TaxID=175537 RepID=UPI00374EF5E8
MKKILLYAVGCVALCACIQAQTLQECKSERDKISGCVEKGYYENGNVSYEAPYENGKQHGVAKEYYENGSLQAQVTYENGNIVSGVCGDGKEIPNIHGLEEQKDIIHKIFESCRE